MTDVDERSRRLADWHELLENTRLADSLEAWQAELRRQADAMRAQGLIDWDDALELRELADAAYSHHLEEAIIRELNQPAPSR